MIADEKRCPCGKPEPHLSADPESNDAVCRVPAFDPETGQILAATVVPMTAIIDFLQARIAEDEAVVGSFHETYCGWRLHEGPGFDDDGCQCGHPARVLAECKAKRAIVELHEPHPQSPYDCSTCGSESADFHSSDLTPIPFPCPTIRALAGVYADREGYRAEWAL